MDFLVQIDNTFNDKWENVSATNKEAAALKLIRKHPNPASLLPCRVYVSIGDMRHDNGAPMAVQGFNVKRV